MRRVSARVRDFVSVAGVDAEDFLQRLLSNDVVSLTPGDACDALLLTPKGRLIALLRVWRRGADDFLLLTEPGLGETVRAQLLRARFAAKVEVDAEEHAAWVVLGGGDGIPIDDYGLPAAEVLDAPPEGEPISAEELERLRIEAGTPAWGRELDERVLPAEAGLVGRAVSLTKGCFPGQEPIARLHYRGHANRALRVLEIEGEELPGYDADLRLGETSVGRITSAVPANGGVVALGYVRAEVDDDAELAVDGRRTRLRALER